MRRARYAVGGHHGFLSIDFVVRSLIKIGGFQCRSLWGVEDEKDAMVRRRRPERPAPMPPWTESPAPTGEWRQGHCTENPGACKDLESGSVQVYGRLRSALWPAAYFTTKKSLAFSSGLFSSRANWIAAPAPVPSGSYRSAPVVVL